MKFTATGVLGYALAMLLSGCMVLGSSEPPQELWQLQAPENIDGARPEPMAGVLLVARPEAPVAYQGTAMAYRQAEHQLRYYARNRWAERPDRQLQSILVDYLERSGLYHAVLASPTTLPVEHRLETELLYLEQDLRSAPGAARIGLRVRLIEPASQRLLLNRTLRIDAGMQAQNPSAGVEAANRALGQALHELAQAIEQALLERCIQAGPASASSNACP